VGVDAVTSFFIRSALRELFPKTSSVSFVSSAARTLIGKPAGKVVSPHGQEAGIMSIAEPARSKGVCAKPPRASPSRSADCARHTVSSAGCRPRFRQRLHRIHETGANLDCGADRVHGGPRDQNLAAGP
jgi:hypothetical protein